ncbi:hypothetical protein NE647_10775 [Blautia coccoides]|uniref:Plasmid segregation centromere-binding protein ParR n=1 Tax=Blautia hominis TaxID=2025493 RepID=A0ABQ0BKQ6_9FIRM|nr:hypothetical protein [Blautia coccoides]MCQ4640906.1 hypothetical protein [Blautia coccoides]
MTEKKYPYKFTIEFNKNNPQHIQVAGILNGLPRREKADYITKAVLAYEGKIEQGKSIVDLGTLKNVIRQILSEEFDTQVMKEETMETVQVIDVSEQSDINDKGADFIKQLSQSLAAFRGKI